MTKGSPAQKKFRATVVGAIEKYTIHWYVATAVLYALMIPLTVWVFPSTTLLVTIVVLFSGFTASVAALASVLTDMTQSDNIDDLQDDVQDVADDGKLNDSA